MKNRWILAVVIILAMGMTGCSTGPKEGAVSNRAEEDSVSAGAREGDAEAANPGNGSAPDGSDESLQEEEIAEGDPVIGIVDSYENDIIVIRDMDDQDIVLYFSTLDAQITEGDSPIAPGDVVEITYKGVQGDAEHPGRAVKVVAESMMYNRERDDK